VSTTTPPGSSLPSRALESPEELIWRLTVRQYHQMLRLGILSEDDPVELLDGWLVTRMPRNPSHRAATLLVRRALERAVPQGWYVDAQEPITLETSEPEPDVVVVRGDTRQYLDRHPGPGDLALVVEVADSSLERDRTLKRRLYAGAGIPIYWILNLLDRELEVYSAPNGSAEAPEYDRVEVHAPGTAAPLLIEG
jgi:Uma2 family endonuclease